MFEIPEAVILARQFNENIAGKKIGGVIAGFTPHKFAFFYGNPQDYPAMLTGKTIGQTVPLAGFLETVIGDMMLVFGVVELRFHLQDEKRPKKHQLLLEFTDGSALSAVAYLYGEYACCKQGEYHNKYYEIAKSKPSPLSKEFDWAYFNRLIATPDFQKLSAKAFLATEQRIPGLGNGVLQDILFNARIHPKRKVESLTENERKTLFQSVKSMLEEMTEQGGRDIEKDLFGKPGGYITKLSQNTVNKPCPVCGGTIIKQPYLGGSIYFCDGCQKI
jgi:formamidopyrimidine-DNA glycosylase